jgi:hypothetical protein
MDVKETLKSANDTAHHKLNEDQRALENASRACSNSESHILNNFTADTVTTEAGKQASTQHSQNLFYRQFAKTALKTSEAERKLASDDYNEHDKTCKVRTTTPTANTRQS